MRSMPRLDLRSFAAHSSPFLELVRTEADRCAERCTAGGGIRPVDSKRECPIPDRELQWCRNSQESGTDQPVHQETACASS